VLASRYSLVLTPYHEVCVNATLIFDEFSKEIRRTCGAFSAPGGVPSAIDFGPNMVLYQPLEVGIVQEIGEEALVPQDKIDHSMVDDLRSMQRVHRLTPSLPISSGKGRR
jgi:hypothetical protein